MLFELGQKKPWLRESCAWAIAGSASSWSKVTAKKAAGITYEKLKTTGFAKSGEGVGIWLALQAAYPDVKPPKDVWTKESPLAVSNLAKVAKVLKESHSKEDGEGSKAKGSWNPKLSFTWDYVLAIYFSSEAKWSSLREEDGAVASWEEFWRVVVDGELKPAHIMAFLLPKNGADSCSQKVSFPPRPRKSANSGDSSFS